MTLRTILISILALAAVGTASGAAAQTAPIAERRAIYERDTDFYGGDIRSLFDTTLEICERACLEDAGCDALTFNVRNAACFLKEGTPEGSAYEGAISARMRPAAAGVVRGAEARAEDLGFLPDGTIDTAHRFAAGLGRDHPVDRQSPSELVVTAQAREAAGQRFAGLQLRLAAVVAGDNPADWVNAASQALLIEGNDRRRARRIARNAAVNAYLRSEGAEAQARALDVLAQALEATNAGRAGIPALRLAQQLAPRPARVAALDRLIGLYGFRITGHDAESDSARPRICARFSEPLIPEFDYGPYVRIEAGALPVEASGNQLCIDGVIHGERYRMTFRSGLPGARGEDLSKPVALDVYVRDRSPAVRAAGQGHVLPRRAGLAVPFVTVNAEELALSLYRVDRRNLAAVTEEGLFGRPLSRYETDRLAGRLGEKVWEGRGEVAETRLNEDQTTLFPIGDVLSAPEPGAYVLTAGLPDGDDDVPAAAQWFTVSDLGATALSGADGLTVLVRGLSDAQAREGVTARLVARNNSVLGETRTDAEGRAVFAAGLLRGDGGAAPGMVELATEADFAFLDLSKPGFDLSDRGVSGRPAPPPIDVFVSTERGVYRPGEMVFATVLARDTGAAAVPDLPLTAVAVRADGVEHRRWVLPDQGAGGRAHAFALPPGAVRGDWRLRLYADPEGAMLAETRFKVEDFVPQKIDFDIGLPDGPLPADAPPVAKLTARYLYGAPGAGLSVEGEVVVSHTREVDAWPGYRFGMARRNEPVQEYLGGFETDDAGNASIPLVYPATEAGTAFQKLDLVLRAREGSGRPVERVATRLIAPTAPRLGLRPLFDGVAAEDSAAGFDVVAIGPDLAATDLGEVAWRLDRVHRWWQWYEVNGRWRYEPVTRRERVSSGAGQVTAAGALRVEAPVAWGRYELRVTSATRPEIRASYAFSAGYYGAGASADTPDVLEVGLDKPRYAPGETAELRVEARAAGTLLVKVMTDRLVDMQAVAVAEGASTVALPVTEDWGPGAYVTATLIRPVATDPDDTAPTRAIGLAWAGVSAPGRVLAAEIEAPDQVDPRGPVEVAVAVPGLPDGAQAYATIAAVDVGILNVTGFESPDPEQHYLGQRRLGMEMRDLYGRLIDTRFGAIGRVRSGGDGGAATGAPPPPTEELVAFFEGPVTVGPDGRARARFTLPEFNGTLRVMAVVWSDAGVGQAEKDVIVRDPVVVSAALPRFLAPGDESRLRLDLAHVDGPTGEVGLTFAVEGPLSLQAGPGTVALESGGRATLSLPLRATGPGQGAIKVVATTPGGRELSKTLRLAVRANDPVLSRQTRLTLAPNGGTLSLDTAVLAGLASGAEATLAVGPLARFDVAGLLRGLDAYPYGCTEQLTSRALPLLYFDRVSEAIGATSAADLPKRIEGAIGAILANQARNGGFGLWRASSGDLWLEAYVTDFLSRANGLGHPVPRRAFDAALENLVNRVAYFGEFENGGQSLAYALMVLAREGRAAIGDLRYYADEKAGAFATPLALAQLGTALAYYGDQPRADALFAQAGQRLAQIDLAKAAQGWREDYGTALRDKAAVVALAAEVGSNAVDRAGLGQEIATGLTGKRWLSTQEQVWALMAADAEIRATAREASVLINGQPVDGPAARGLDAGVLSGGFLLANAGPQPLDVIVTATGVPTEPEPAQGNGYRIERWVYTLEGEPVADAGVALNDRLVVILRVTPEREVEGRLMVSDPLPAGLEIDNPNLLRAGDMRQLDWLRLDDVAEHSEFRSDRFLAAVDWRGSDSFQLAYMVRAVSPGSFHHPAASVEDMYRPDNRARTDAGRFTVRP